MPKLLIFGMTGFLGKALLQYMRDEAYTHYQIYGVGRKDFTESFNSFRYIKISRDFTESIKDVLQEIRPDYIINLIGNYAVGFSTLLETNVVLTSRIYEALVQQNIPVKKILLIGSAAEYGIPEQCPVTERDTLRPVTEYGLVKTYQTFLAQFYYVRFGINYNIARVFNVIGKESSRKLAIGNFYHQIEQIREEGTIHVGNLQNRRDYVSASDVAKAFICILNKGEEAGIYNVCSGRSICMREILQMMIQASGKKIDVVSTSVSQADVSDIYGENDKLVEDTGWNFERDIERIVDGMF